MSRSRAPAPYLAVLAVVLLLRWPTLSNDIFSIDEVWHLTGVARLHSLQEFAYAFSYRAETKTQIGLLPSYLADALDPTNAILLVRISGLLEALVGAWLLIAFTRRFFGSSKPGVIAALIWLVYLEIGPGYPLPASVLQESFQAIRLEHTQSPLILASLLAFAFGSGFACVRPRPRWWPLAGAGVAWALSVLVQPSSVLVGPVYVAALALAYRPDGAHRRAFVGAAMPFTAGAAVPIVLVFGPYLLSAGALADLRFNLVDVNAAYATHSWDLAWRIVILLLALPPLLVLFWLAGVCLLFLRFPAHLTGPGRRILLLVTAVGPAVFIGYLPGHAHFHYMIPVVAPLALSAASYWVFALESLVTTNRARLVRMSTIAIAAVYVAAQLPAMAIFAASGSTGWYLADDRARFDLDGLVRYIQANTAPSARIWAYYYVPEVYVLSRRKPATSDPVGGALTLAWDEPWFGRTLAELERERPELIIGINNTHMARPQAGGLSDIPRVSAWIVANYTCDRESIRGVTLCTRSTS